MNGWLSLASLFLLAHLITTASIDPKYDDNYIALDDFLPGVAAWGDPDDNQDLSDSSPDDEDEDDDVVDIRSFKEEQESPEQEQHKLVKRDWTYKCEPSECNKRCLDLLKLPEGACGYLGKCYCRRNPKSSRRL